MNPLKIFYMNQGGGNWGAIHYSNYDLILLAERDTSVDPLNFDVRWGSGDSLPPMSIQVNYNDGRLISSPIDLDRTSQHVRPIISFKIVGTNIRIVFVHLKSGNAPAATNGLQNAVSSQNIQEDMGSNKPILWIGDFNRAGYDKQLFSSAQLLYEGGGQSKWYLDRVYATGRWQGFTVTVQKVTESNDHRHVGLGIEIVRK